MQSVALKRKLIDSKPGAVGILSEKAAMAGLSLKRYLESVLEEEALKTERDCNPTFTCPSFVPPRTSFSRGWRLTDR